MWKTYGRCSEVGTVTAQEGNLLIPISYRAYETPKIRKNDNM